jgi:hypothetical protein
MSEAIRQDLVWMNNPKFKEFKALKAAVEHLAQGHDELEKRVIDLEGELGEAGRG